LSFGIKALGRSAIALLFLINKVYCSIISVLLSVRSVDTLQRV